METLAITLVSQDIVRKLRAETYRSVEKGLAGDLRGAKRAGEFLGSTFNFVVRSYPASSAPLLKVADLRDEAEGL
jgi:hypothetical protein